MIGLEILLGVTIVAFAVLQFAIYTRAREERRDLEDRLMALTNMDATILHKAQSEPVAGDISYVDEQREWELSPGGGGYEDG